MSAIAGPLLMLLGTVFVVAAGIGVVRLPDAFARMHAATKAGTLGAALLLAGAALSLGGEAWLTGFLTVLVMFVTLPVAAQMLGRAAYVAGTPMADLSTGDPLVGILPRAAPSSGHAPQAGEEADASAPLSCRGSPEA